MTQIKLREAAERGPEELSERIGRARSEWDFERVVEVEASLTGLMGLVLGAISGRRFFFFMPGIAASMLLVHALHGWYPLLPVLRRIGVRSQNEIDTEYYALKLLRGDFDQVSSSAAEGRAAAAWAAVTM
jgi:hypothetical protein